jgi:hypothetical protein
VRSEIDVPADAVDGTITELDLFECFKPFFVDKGPKQLTLDEQAGLIRMMARLTRMWKLTAHWDAELLGQVAAARAGMGAHAPLRSLKLFLLDECTALGPELGAVLATLDPGLEVRTAGGGSVKRAMLPGHASGPCFCRAL